MEIIYNNSFILVYQSTIMICFKLKILLTILTVSMIGIYPNSHISNIEAQMLALNEDDHDDVNEATEDYYNEYYINNLILSNQSEFENQSAVNISNWKIDTSNNGWTIAQSWVQKEDTESNVYVKYSDNGGRNYSIPQIVCPGGVDKRSGIYGAEFWILCTKPVGGVNNLFIQETRTNSTPLSNLTNISIEKLENAKILDFEVNKITGMVVAAWTEGDTIMGGNNTGFIPTYCYRC